MHIKDAQRFGRHIALPEVGPVGQQRILDAVVALVASSDAGMGLETAAMYLAGSGVRKFRVLISQAEAVPDWLPRLQVAYPVAQFETMVVATAGSAWSAALTGCNVAVRDSFADDSFTEACRRRAIRGVVIRGDENSIDVLSLRPSSQTMPSSVPSIPPSGPISPLPPSATHQAVMVVAGTFAAAEALWLVAGRDSCKDPCHEDTDGLIRHLRVPFSSPTDRPETRNIPWPPV